jgi:hypothetical protein
LKNITLIISKKKIKKLIQIDVIDKLLTFEEIREYSIDIIKLRNNYLLNRISELKDLCDSEEDSHISLESCKGMFLFIETIGNISKPSSLTVTESRFFYLEWERDRNKSITVRFKKDYFLEYVIFKPSSHIAHIPHPKVPQREITDRKNPNPKVPQREITDRKNPREHKKKHMQ